VATRHAGAAPPVSQRACSTLGRRLLELLRADLLSEPGRAGCEPTEVLALLAAVEGVREAIEPNWAQHFSSRLSGPDGLDLVVEVAHDLRSPLTSILFLAETLQRRLERDERRGDERRAMIRPDHPSRIIHPHSRP